MTRDERAHAYALVILQTADGYIDPETCARRAYALADAMADNAEQVTGLAAVDLSKLEAHVAATLDPWGDWTSEDGAANSSGPDEPNVPVFIRLRNGEEYGPYAVASVRWTHVGGGGDVVAFRRA